MSLRSARPRALFARALTVAAVAAGTLAWPATARPAGAAVTSYSFELINQSSGQPVRYNPCQAVHIRVNVSRAPSGAIDDLGQVLRELSAATGISFIVDGTTEEVDQPNRGLTNPGYGPGFVPVNVDWQLPGDSGYPLDPSILGYGGSEWVANSAGDGVFVTGAVVINAGAGLPMGFAPAGQESDGKVLLHEFGHLLGLGHVGDVGQVMYPDPGQGPASYGPGDQAGLAAVGRPAGCLAEPSPGGNGSGTSSAARVLPPGSL